jgi:hypothetical protein
VFGALAYVHGLLFRGCLWLLRLPFRTLWSAFLAFLALLGEEFRRWAGLAVSGLLILGAGKATLNYAPASLKRPLVLTVLTFLVIWALAVRRAAHLTKENNLRQVRQRKAFQELKGDVHKIGEGVGGRVLEGAATRARGTLFEGMFGSNRAAHRDAEAERAAEADRAAAEVRAAAEDDRRREELADLEPDIYGHRR